MQNKNTFYYFTSLVDGNWNFEGYRDEQVAKDRMEAMRKWYASIGQKAVLTYVGSNFDEEAFNAAHPRKSDQEL